MVEIEVATYPTRMEAELWAQFLQVEGIPVVVVPIGPGTEVPVNEALWPHVLRVRDSDAQKARGLLDTAPH